ncbi:MAG: hypothetical protein VW447_05205, partial [Limnobacter sp.]
VVISAAMWFLGKVVPDKVKNSLPVDETKGNPTSEKHSQVTPQNPVHAHNKLSSTPMKNSPLRPFGIVLLVGLLVAALASHPWVHAQFQSIGAFF